MQFKTDRTFNTTVSDLFLTMEPDVDTKSKNSLDAEILNCLSDNKAKNTKKNNILKLYPEFTKICRNDFTEELKEKWDIYLKNKKDYIINKLKNGRNHWSLSEGKQSSYIYNISYRNNQNTTELNLTTIRPAFVCYIYPIISYDFIKDGSQKNISDLLDINIDIGYTRSIKNIHDTKYMMFFESKPIYSYKKSDTDYDDYSNFLIFPIFIKDFYTVYNEEIKDDYVLDTQSLFDILTINNKIKNKLFAYILSTIIYSNGKTITKHIAKKNKKLLQRTLEKIISPGEII